MAERAIAGKGINLVTGCPDRQECMGCEVPLMHVPRCETCRWWQANSCMSDGSGDCLRVSKWPTKADTPSGQVLRTAPDFGCVQWEGKE